MPPPGCPVAPPTALPPSGAPVAPEEPPTPPGLGDMVCEEPLLPGAEELGPPPGGSAPQASELTAAARMSAVSATSLILMVESIMLHRSRLHARPCSGGLRPFRFGNRIRDAMRG